MPMDDRTKATVRALLDRYPRGYVQEETGFTVTKTAAGLFRLLCLAVLADDSAPSEKAVKAAKALLERRWDSAPEMAKSSEDERTRVLERAGYPGAADASRRLGEATGFVLDRYDGDLNGLRRAADGDGRRLRSLIRQIPGLSDAGYAVNAATRRSSGRRPGRSSISTPSGRRSGSACPPIPRRCCATWHAARVRRCSAGWPGRSRSSTPATSMTRCPRLRESHERELACQRRPVQVRPAAGVADRRPGGSHGQPRGAPGILAVRERGDQRGGEGVARAGRVRYRRLRQRHP